MILYNTKVEFTDTLKKDIIIKTDIGTDDIQFVENENKIYFLDHHNNKINVYNYSNPNVSKRFRFENRRSDFEYH